MMNKKEVPSDQSKTYIEGVGEIPTLRKLQSSIPRHLWKPDTRKSMKFLIIDFLVIALLFLVTYQLSPLLPQPFKGLLWVLYWFFQGTMFWSLFVIGHDCTHRSFSSNKRINDAAGYLVLTFILLPFASFKHTHANHHRNCAHYNNDEGYGPMDEDCPINPKSRIIMAFPTIAYWLYLVGVSRHKTNHFSPFSKRFEKVKNEIIISLLALCVPIAMCFVLSMIYSFQSVLYFYLIPVLVYGTYFMMVTFLQHNDENMPWYGEQEWTFVKGAMSSVDRSFGWLDGVVHNIGTHQIHHLFPFIPHYNLVEATRYYNAEFPQFARKSNDRWIPSYIKNVRNYIRYGDAYNDEHFFRYTDIIKKRHLNN